MFNMYWSANKSFDFIIINGFDKALKYKKIDKENCYYFV